MHSIDVFSSRCASFAALQRIGRFRREADKQKHGPLPFVTRLTQSGHWGNEPILDLNQSHENVLTYESPRRRAFPMRCAILLGCVIVFMASNAGADLITECTNDLRPEVRVRACTQIIEDKTASFHDKVNAYVSRGDARTDAGAAATALADFDEALRRENANVAALRGRARAYLFLGKNLSSIADYTAWIGSMIFQFLLAHWQPAHLPQ